jgi:hypothetical protein
LFVSNVLFFPVKITVLFDKSHIDDLSDEKKYLDSLVNLLKSKRNDSITRDLYLNIASEYYYK